MPSKISGQLFTIIEEGSRNFKRTCRKHDPALGAIVVVILIGILVLAILGLGWQAFLSGIARGAQQVVDNPVVDEAKEYLGDFAKDTAKHGD